MGDSDEGAFPPEPSFESTAATGGGFLEGTKHALEFLWKGGSGGEPAGGRACLVQSDHGFDNFISPVTNPSLFEDPRALTEVRPIGEEKSELYPEPQYFNLTTSILVEH